jgi:hypothetical protein
MLWSHCFAVFLLVPFGVAELARWRQRRKADWTVGMVFVTACALALPLYLRLLGNARALIFPPQFITDWPNLGIIYAAVVLRRSVLALLLVSLLVALRPSVRKRAYPGALPGSERVFLGAVFLIPLCLHLVLARGQNPFWMRYAIGYGFFGSLVVGAALHRFARRDLVCAAIAAVALAMTVGHDAARMEARLAARAAAGAWYRQVRPDLPLVCANGLTYIEMNQRENDRFLARVYYLNDRAAALEFAHATIFEGFPELMPYIGGKAQLQPYSAFTREHRQFLVLGTVGFPEDWLLPKLAADGAVVKELDDRETGYKDRTLLEVTLPGK